MGGGGGGGGGGRGGQTGLDWLNTVDHQPLTLGELRGKLLLLDFWTYG